MHFFSCVPCGHSVGIDGVDLTRVITSHSRNSRRFRWWHQMLVLSLVLSFAFNCDIPYQPQAHPRKFTPPWMRERTWRTQVWNHGPHLKDERTTGPYSLIESRSIYRDKHLNPAGYRTDTFYETLGYSTLVLILTCDPKRPPDQLILFHGNPRILSLHSLRALAYLHWDEKLNIMWSYF